MEQKNTFNSEEETVTANNNFEENDTNADADVSGTSDAGNADEKKLTEKLQDELTEQKDKYIRLFAEFDNYKRRSAKERIELIQTAGREVITSMLDVLDDCDRAEKQLQTSNDIDQLKQGVQLVFGKLRTVMQSKGLKAMESINTVFDVEKHEAITEIPAPNDDMKDKILDEVQKGYYLNDKIIRFAKVVVGK